MLKPIEMTMLEVPTLQPMEDPVLEQGGYFLKGLPPAESPCCNRYSLQELMPMEEPCWSRFSLKGCRPWRGLILVQGKSMRRNEQQRGTAVE